VALATPFFTAAAVALTVAAVVDVIFANGLISPANDMVARRRFG
jgi:hypothetical protein